MKRLAEPEALPQFRAAGGVVDYSVFEGAGHDQDSVKIAMGRHFNELRDLWRPWVKLEELFRLPHREIDQGTFFGDWYDLNTRSLVLCGSGSIEGRGKLVNPLFVDLNDCSIGEYWGSSRPEIGSGGQYAYAFCNPPYSIDASFLQLQMCWREINKFILPTEHYVIITDWSSSELGKLSNYFEAGLEWWGVFLFTIFTPELQQLAVVSASTTD